MKFDGLKSFTIALLTLLGLTLHLGCARDGKSKPVKDAKLEFGPKLNPVPSFSSQLQGFKFDKLVPSTSEVSLGETSADFFELVESLFVVSQNSELKLQNKSVSREMAHKLLQYYYKNEDHYSTFGPLFTPYLHVTMGLKENEIKEKYDGVIDRTIPEVRRLIMEIEWPELKNIDDAGEYRLEAYMSRIRAFLRQIPHSLTQKSSGEDSADAIPKEIVASIANAIERDFIPQINSLERKLAVVGFSRAPTENIRILREVYNNFELLRGSSALAFINKIIDDGERDLTAGYWGLAQYAPDRIGNGRVLIRHGNALNHFINFELKKVTADAFVLTMNKRKERAFFLKTVHELGRDEVIERVFGSKKLLPATELNVRNVRLSINSGVTSDLSPDNRSQTGAEVLGTGMTALYHRLQSIEKYENIFPSQLEGHQLIFSHLNKVMKMVGLPYEDGGFRAPYFESIDGEGTYDVFNYFDKTKSGELKFVIPDELEIDSGFDVISNRDLPNATVKGRASLIKAGSQMLSFLRPDRVSWFDRTMGTHYYAKKVALFPKESLFDLHLGFLATNLSNLERIGTQVVTKDKNVMDVSELSGPVKDATMAAVTDIVSGHHSDLVKSVDLAEMILAVREFINSVEDLPPGVSQALAADPETGEFVKHKKLKDAETSLRKFVLGMSFYLVSKMKNPSGGFYSSVNLKSDFRSEVFELKSQVSSIEALVTAYELWGSKIFLNSAIDAYRRTHQVLFLKDIGFFASSDKDRRLPDLGLSLRALRSFGALAKHLPISEKRDLIEALDLWSEQISNGLKNRVETSED